MNSKGMTPDEILAFAKKMQGEEKSEDKIKESLMNNLSSEQSKKLKNILGDKSAVEKLLASEQAQQLMKKLGGK